LSPPHLKSCPRRREWVGREILAHIDEMLPYWLGEIERVLAGRSSPFRSDVRRPTLSECSRSIETGPCRSPSSTRAWTTSLERVLRRLLELDERQVARRGLNKQRGEMTGEQIVDAMLASHLEDHCKQMSVALDAEVAARA